MTCQVLQSLIRTHHFVPVKLTHSTLGQVLLSSGNVVTRRQISDDLLTNPSTVQDTGLGVGETPLEVGNDTLISGLLTKAVGVLEVNLLVGSAYLQQKLARDVDEAFVSSQTLTKDGGTLSISADGLALLELAARCAKNGGGEGESQSRKKSGLHSDDSTRTNAEKGSVMQ